MKQKGFQEEFRVRVEGLNGMILSGGAKLGGFSEHTNLLRLKKLLCGDEKSLFVKFTGNSICRTETFRKNIGSCETGVI